MRCKCSRTRHAGLGRARAAAWIEIGVRHDIKVDRMLARDRVSRGRQKLLAAALILAQIQATSSSVAASS